jgi:hypothetical protein
MTGYDPSLHADEVQAGMFVGWAHSPAALVWRFPVGRGRVTVTTFRLARERGPVASVLRDALVHLA